MAATAHLIGRRHVHAPPTPAGNPKSSFLTLPGSNGLPGRAAPFGTFFAVQKTMLLLIAILFGIAWVGGFSVLHITAVSLHVLLILAFASVLIHFLSRRPVT